MITAKKPDHPANSFFYDNYDELPRIGNVLNYRAQMIALMKQVFWLLNWKKRTPQLKVKVAVQVPSKFKTYFAFAFDDNDSFEIYVFLL